MGGGGGGRVECVRGGVGVGAVGGWWVGWGVGGLCPVHASVYNCFYCVCVCVCVYVCFCG